MEKILDIVELIAYEKGLNVDSVISAVKEAIVITARKSLDEHISYDVEIDKKNKTLKLYQKILVCTPDDPRLCEDQDNFLSILEAKKMDSSVEIGDELRYELSLENMSRSAVNMLYKELEFHIQRLIETQLFDKYKAQVGKIVSGGVVRVDDAENTFIEIDEIRAILPKKNRIKGEVFKVGNVVSAILRHVSIDRKNGIQIELSRTTPKLLEELLRLEVPEIKDGDVVIERCARLPGERAKIALSSVHAKVDAVGATVGVKGVRINAVGRELNNENIDCIEYSPIPEIFVARALSPALISSVKIESENRAIVALPSEQKPKAIGKNGVNIRLASMLTGIEIELLEQDGVFGATTNTNESHEKGDISSLASLFKE